MRERWFALSLVQQMINIGNEVKRGLKYDLDPDKKAMFFEKALQYIQLTIGDCKNAHVLPELYQNLL